MLARAALVTARMTQTLRNGAKPLRPRHFPARAAPFRRHSLPSAYRAAMGFVRFSIPVVLIVAAAAGAAMEARAHLFDGGPDRVVVASSEEVSMDQAVKMAEQRFKARVVRADTQHEGIRTIYILKVLDESGRVWTVRVDATNGTIL